MPVITLDLHASAAPYAMPFLSTFLPFCRANLQPGQGAAMEVPQSHWPAVLGVDSQLLLLVLPDELRARLEELGEAEFFVYSSVDQDGRVRHQRLALETEGLAVEVNAWSPRLPRRPFYVALIAGDLFVLTRHGESTGPTLAPLVADNAESVYAQATYVPVASSCLDAAPSGVPGCDGGDSSMTKVQCVAFTMRSAGRARSTPA